MKDEIIGIERVLQNRDKGFKWNNKKIRWSIAHNFNNQTKGFDVELEMVLVSSKRIVKVNENPVDTQMCSFGYEANFQISPELKGYIKQQGLGFQLYINGESFTKLQENNQAYEPPKLAASTLDSLESNNRPSSDFLQSENSQSKRVKPAEFKKADQQRYRIKKPSSFDSFNQIYHEAKNCHQQKSCRNPEAIAVKKQEESKNQSKLALKQKFSSEDSIGPQKSNVSKIKDTQSELMKILIEQKQKKKRQREALQSKISDQKDEA